MVVVVSVAGRGISLSLCVVGLPHLGVKHLPRMGCACEGSPSPRHRTHSSTANSRHPPPVVGYMARGTAGGNLATNTHNGFHGYLICNQIATHTMDASSNTFNWYLAGNDNCQAIAVPDNWLKKDILQHVISVNLIIPAPYPHVT